MEDESNIGSGEKAGIVEDGTTPAIPNAMAIMVAHNRVLMERESSGQPNTESLKSLLQLVADAPEHVVRTLFPGKPETVEL